jgi:hypothetical protein
MDFFSKILDELLTQILQDVSILHQQLFLDKLPKSKLSFPRESLAWVKQCAFLGEMSLTCKRFNKITQPVLYNTIRLSAPFETDVASHAARHSMETYPTREQYSHRTMEENPILRKFCKKLIFSFVPPIFRELDSVEMENVVVHAMLPEIMYVESIQPKNMVACNELVVWLNKVTVFEVHGGFYSPLVSTMVDMAVKSMRQCSELALFAGSLSQPGGALILDTNVGLDSTPTDFGEIPSLEYGEFPSLVQICTDFVTPQLRSLRIKDGRQYHTRNDEMEEFLKVSNMRLSGGI